MKIQTLRQNLQKRTVKNNTAEAYTDKLISELKYAADEGEDLITAHIPKDVSYEVLANLTNPLCALTCVCIDGEESLFEISWV